MQGSRVPIGTAYSTITYSAAITPSSPLLAADQYQQQTFTAATSRRPCWQSGTDAELRLDPDRRERLASAGRPRRQTTTDSFESRTRRGASCAGTDTLSLQRDHDDGFGVVLATGSATITVLGNIGGGRHLAVQPDPGEVRGTLVFNFVVQPPPARCFQRAATTGSSSWVAAPIEPDAVRPAPRDLGGSGGGTIGVGIGTGDHQRPGDRIERHRGDRERRPSPSLANPFGHGVERSTSSRTGYPSLILNGVGPRTRAAMS